MTHKVPITLSVYLKAIAIIVGVTLGTFGILVGLIAWFSP